MARVRHNTLTIPRRRNLQELRFALQVHEDKNSVRASDESRETGDGAVFMEVRKVGKEGFAERRNETLRLALDEHRAAAERVAAPGGARYERERHALAEAHD